MVKPDPSLEVEVRIKGLTVEYSGKTVLSGVDLSIYKNEIFGIIGPANSGKTSFLPAPMENGSPGMPTWR